MTILGFDMLPTRGKKAELILNGLLSISQVMSLYVIIADICFFSDCYCAKHFTYCFI